MAKNIDDIQFAEGDSIDASVMNARFDEIGDGIEDLPIYAIQKDSLKSEHLPSFVPTDVAPGAVTAALTSETLVKAPSEYPAWDDIDADVTIIWDDPVDLGMEDTYKIAGILVLANLVIRNSSPYGVGLITGCQGVCIQVTDDVVTWTKVDRTIRWIRPIDGDKWYNFLLSEAGYPPNTEYAYPTWEIPIAIRTYISSADTSTFQGVRLAFSNDDQVMGGAALSGNVTFRECNITAIPLHALEDL